MFFKYSEIFVKKDTRIINLRSDYGASDYVFLDEDVCRKEAEKSDRQDYCPYEKDFFRASFFRFIKRSSAPESGAKTASFLLKKYRQYQ